MFDSRPLAVEGAKPASECVTCVACGAVLDSRDWIRVPPITLRACPRCASLTALPRPTPEAQAALHDRVDYFAHEYFDHRRRNEQRTRARCHDVFERIAGAVNLNGLKGARHLDIGCDTGQFLAAAAAAYGLVPVGLDVASRSIERARANGIEAYPVALEDAPPSLGTFTVITAIDLIEHLAEPVRFFEQVAQRLTPDGACYVETPNIASTVYSVGAVLAALSKGRSSAAVRLFPPEHVQYFSAAGLARAAARAGLTVVRSGTRVLPRHDVGVGAVTGAIVAALQALDVVRGTRILHWAVLQKTGDVSA
jgi:2-polyprenyl-3-methyl-5-hydroxy-6-metoxy-1,4-benzoquinol methylase